jgi:hypothetical protein
MERLFGHAKAWAPNTIFSSSLRLGRQLQNFRAHFFAGAEFDGSAGRNGYIIFGLVWIAPDARLADFHLKNTEIPEFDLVVLGQSLGNVIEGFLHHVKYLLLSQVRFFADSRNQMPFSKSHILRFVSDLYHLTPEIKFPPRASARMTPNIPYPVRVCIPLFGDQPGDFLVPYHPVFDSFFLYTEYIEVRNRKVTFIFEPVAVASGNAESQIPTPNQPHEFR